MFGVLDGGYEICAEKVVLALLFVDVGVDVHRVGAWVQDECQVDPFVGSQIWQGAGHVATMGS